MTSRKFFLLAALLCVFPAVEGDGDPLAGKQKSIRCTHCHGVDGNSPTQNVPKLAGQLESYIVQAVTEFQQGIRSDPTMSDMIDLIESGKDLEDIAAYFAQQPKMRGQQRDNEITAAGARLFTSQRCNFCHGDDGKRYTPFRESDPPVIGGQHKAYLIKAMNDIRDGKRPGDIYDLMPKILGELSGAQIEAIAEYLSGL